MYPSRDIGIEPKKLIQNFIISLYLWPEPQAITVYLLGRKYTHFADFFVLFF
jgi:hypothetical protein